MDREIPEQASGLGAGLASLYGGLLVADDIEQLAERLDKATGSVTQAMAGPFILAPGGLDSIDGYLGNHDDLGRPLPGELQTPSNSPCGR